MRYGLRLSSGPWSHEAGVDLVLVGDSVANVVLGYESTIPVTLDEMIGVCRAVRRGAKRALLVGDLPFGSYHESPEQAIRSSVRLVKEGGVEAVKLEGGRSRADVVRRIVDAEIPVLGHIGLTPQSVHRLGGYRVQGKTVDAARALVEDALALEDAGSSPSSSRRCLGSGALDYAPRVGPDDRNRRRPVLRRSDLVYTMCRPLVRPYAQVRPALRGVAGVIADAIGRYAADVARERSGGGRGYAVAEEYHANSTSAMKARGGAAERSA